MAEVEVAGGVMLDIASGNEVRDSEARLLDRIGGLRPERPLALTRENQQNAVVNVPTVLRLGKPHAGRIWSLVYLTVAGADDRTVVANATVASYIGNPDNPSLTGLIDPANGSVVPNSASFSDKQFWVHDDESLFVIVYGAAAGQSLVAVARVLDFPALGREGSYQV